MIRFLPLFLLLLYSCSGVKSISVENSVGGNEIILRLDTLNLKTREETILNEIKNGHTPKYMDTYSEITITQELNGVKYILTYFVKPDYFSLGRDNDYFLIPMTPLLAQKTADYYDCILPTRKMVDQIYSSAKIKFFPQPIPPSKEMITIKVFAKHNDSVRIQRRAYFKNNALTDLAAGHKKDVIISDYIYSNLKQNVPKPVVIYGWHKVDGNPIQPLYNGHGENYADYSHGIRLIKRKALLNNKIAYLDQILKDSILCKLISDEGVIEKAFYTPAN
jgi:hypothetical protein